MNDAGIVYLVGAGPGDPDLITLAGLKRLAEADIVVYDKLANPALLDHAPGKAERVYVGKSAQCHELSQEQINELLVTEARKGRIVARLKGGDPFVFGRGAEEALALRRAGVRFEVVPGVTAGVAAAAYAGIPVTHRQFNSTLTFITGHEDPRKTESAVDWRSLAGRADTLVFYMGVRNLAEIARKLVDAGRSPRTPVAVIQQATGHEQRVVQGTLADIDGIAADANLAPPAIIVVGDVVKLRAELNWYEERPLFGKTIVVTRTRSQASRLAEKIERLGGRVLAFPTIRIVPPDDAGPLQAAIAKLPAFDWIVFTSENAVDAFFAALNRMGRDSRCLGGVLVCCIGPGTAAALNARGIRPDLMPECHTTEDVFELLNRRGCVSGKSFLLPRSNIADKELPCKLREAGGKVEEVVAYRTLSGEPAPDVLEALRHGEADIVTFTSSSTAKNFASIVRTELGGPPAGVSYASIGPQTSRAAAEEGLEISVEAKEHTIDGLVAAIADKFGKCARTPFEKG